MVNGFERRNPNIINGYTNQKVLEADRDENLKIKETELAAKEIIKKKIA